MADKLLYLDTSAIAHARKAGGIELLDAYKLMAGKDGYHLVMTDVVRAEIKRSKPLETNLDGWIEKNNITIQPFV